MAPTQHAPGPAARPPDRAAALAAALAPAHLPTPPTVALQLTAVASRTDCRAGEIVSILGQDPALCAKILRAVNSCLYGLARPVASLDRAVVILGLNPLRSLALALSLPPMTRAGATDPGARQFWLESVTGAVLARELAARLRRPSPEDDLVAGLLRDLGMILLQKAFPEPWRALAPGRAGCLPSRACALETRVLGVSHAEVGAELLRRWNLPDEIVAPIRHHHAPDPTGGASWADRAERLYFVECLTRLDPIANEPGEFDRFLAVAQTRFQLPPRALIALLEAVAPKIDAFVTVLGADLGAAPNLVTTFSTALARHVTVPVGS